MVICQLQIEKSRVKPRQTYCQYPLISHAKMLRQYKFFHKDALENTAMIAPIGRCINGAPLYNYFKKLEICAFGPNTKVAFINQLYRFQSTVVRLS